MHSSSTQHVWTYTKHNNVQQLFFQYDFLFTELVLGFFGFHCTLVHMYKINFTKKNRNGNKNILEIFII